MDSIGLALLLDSVPRHEGCSSLNLSLPLHVAQTTILRPLGYPYGQFAAASTSSESSTEDKNTTHHSEPQEGTSETPPSSQSSNSSKPSSQPSSPTWRQRRKALKKEKRKERLSPELVEVERGHMATILEKYHAEDRGALMEYGTYLVTCILGGASRFFMSFLNTTHVHDGEKMSDFLINRESDVGLISVSNHVSAVDDPFTLVPLMPLQWLLTAPRREIRWEFCATDRCFLNPPLDALFSCGKVLPVIRGGGLEQEALTFAARRLGQGEWLHIFPEGTRTRNGQLGPMRPGVGKLVVDSMDMSGHLPIVVPFVHAGMESALSWCPVGNDFHVLVGDPVPVDDIVMDAYNGSRFDRKKAYNRIAGRIGKSLKSLQTELADRLTKYLPAWSTETDSVVATLGGGVE